MNLSCGERHEKMTNEYRRENKYLSLYNNRRQENKKHNQLVDEISQLSRVL